MRVIFKKEQLKIQTDLYEYKILQTAHKNLIKEDNEKIIQIASLKLKNDELEEEVKLLKAQVEHYKNVVSMKNQEENLASIYDEYLYGAKKQEVE